MIKRLLLISTIIACLFVFTLAFSFTGQVGVPAADQLQVAAMVQPADYPIFVADSPPAAFVATETLNYKMSYLNKTLSVND